jgi:hypothetical protein
MMPGLLRRQGSAASSPGASGDIVDQTMPPPEPPDDQDGSLPSETARDAVSSRAGATWYLREVVMSRLAAEDEARARCLELADRLANSTDREEQSRLKEELVRIAFGR